MISAIFTAIWYIVSESIDLNNGLGPVVGTVDLLDTNSS